MENQNFQVAKLPQSKISPDKQSRARSNRKNCLSAPGIFYAQGKQSPFFLEKVNLDQRSLCSGQNTGYKISSQLAVCAHMDQGNILASKLMPAAK